VVFAYFLLGERLDRRALLGLGVALLGVGIFLGEPTLQEHWLGVGLQFVGMLFNAIANIQAKRLSDLHPITINAVTALLAAPVLGLLSAGLEHDQFASLAGASWKTPASIGFLAIVSTLVGFSGFYYLLKRYPVGWVTSIVLLVPLSGAIAGVGLMNDRLSWLSGLGGGAMLAGVGLIIVRPGTFARRNEIAPTP
jgi:O-acetylserine/cysteine efflux transporter